MTKIVEPFPKVGDIWKLVRYRVEVTAMVTNIRYYGENNNFVIFQVFDLEAEKLVYWSFGEDDNNVYTRLSEIQISDR